MYSRAVHSGSWARAFPGGFPQSLHIAHRRQAKEAFVFPTKVRSVVITDAVSCARRIKALAEHQPAGLLQPQPLLELQWAHRRDGLEVVVEARDAHPELVRDAVYPKRLVKVFMEALNGLDDVRGVAA